MSVQTDPETRSGTEDAGTQVDARGFVPERRVVDPPPPPRLEDDDDEPDLDATAQYLDEIEKFSRFVYGRAFKQLIRILGTISTGVAQQTDQLDGKRRKQKETEARLVSIRAALKDSKTKLVVMESRYKTVKGTKGASKDEIEKALLKQVEAQGKVKELETSETQTADELTRIKDAFSKVPNEGVYDDAFRAMDAAVQEYVDAVTNAARVVNQRRKDGPMRSIDAEDIRAAADSLELVLKKTYSELEAFLTYKTRVGDSEEGTPRFLDGTLQIDRQNVESSVDLDQYSARLAVFERIRINRYNAVLNALRDVDSVHVEVSKKLAKPMSAWGAVDSFDVALLYALKIARIGMIFSASFISTRAFETLYAERMSSKKADVPDLKWLVAAFVIFTVLFDFVLLGVIYFVSIILPDKLDNSLVYDFAVDTFVANTMAAISLFPIADIVQDSRWFDYQVQAPRALRLMRELCFSLSAFHALIPYFYLTGPFYIQHKRAATEKL